MLGHDNISNGTKDRGGIGVIWLDPWRNKGPGAAFLPNNQGYYDELGVSGDYANFLRIGDCDVNEQVGVMPDMIYGNLYDSNGQSIGRDYLLPHRIRAK